MASIAVIGGGLAGLTVARELVREHPVTVFEKSRGVGGRIATRYNGDLQFDHGAQFFTARSAAFRGFLQPLIKKNVVASWPAVFSELQRDRVVATRQWEDDHPHYVGAPRMNAIGKWLAAGLDVRLQTAVTRLERRDNRWLLIDPAGLRLGQFDWVIVTAPAAQTTELLPENSLIRRHSEAARMRGCFALMLAFERPLELPWQAALVHAADISWVSVNSSKPGRKEAFCLVAHSSNAWADAHMDDNEESIMSHLLAECSAVTGVELANAAFCQVHRWRYANIEEQSGAEHCIEPELQLAACGDWFIRGRIEAAFISAASLAKALKTHL